MMKMSASLITGKLTVLCLTLMLLAGTGCWWMSFDESESISQEQSASESLSQSSEESQTSSQGQSAGSGSGQSTDKQPEQNSSSSRARKANIQISNGQTASSYLLGALKEAGYRTEGTTTVTEDTGDLNLGEVFWRFAWGKSTPEKFTAEKHFAVTESGQIWEYDIAENKWVLLD